MKKKIGIILFIILNLVLLLGIGYQVYAKYILSKKASISFNTADYYFEPELNIKATKTLPVTVDVTVKNHNGTDYTDTDLKYNLRISDGYTLTVVDGLTQRTLEGGKKSEETFKVTINKTGNQENENIHIYFNITTPYTTTESTKIAYQDVYNYDYTGNYEEFIALATGTYKIECWGAQGGSYGTEGGKGAYTSGEIELKENDKLYVYVGQVGSANRSVAFNGGGAAGSIYDARSGGGATDVRLYITDGGTWNNFESLKSRIMVAGAGGGSDNYGEGSNGGYGGALTGGSGSYYRSPLATTSYTVAYGGTQTSGGASGVGTYTLANGAFGLGVSSKGHGSGGGGGYYGGGAGNYDNSVVGSGAGGSSFISGHSGCNAIAESSTSSNIVHTGQANHYSGYVFTNTKMIAGNASMPTHDETSTMVGNTGDGYVKITFITESRTLIGELIGQPASDVNQTAYDIYGNKIVLPAGFTVVAHGTDNVTYDYTGDSSSPSVYDGVVIQDEDENQFVWVPVNNQTSYSYERAAFSKDGWTYTQKLGDYDTDSKSYEIIREDKADYIYTEAMPNISQSRTELQSVLKYGGFYIGRYEVGVVGHDSTVLETNTNEDTLWTGYNNGTAVVQKGCQVWNYITRDKSKEIAEGMYSDSDSVISRLISSYAWDTTLKFIETEYPEYSTNSVQGNYRTSEFTYTDLNGNDQTKAKGDYLVVPTGQTTPLKNIYDLGGNVWEWTTEAYSDSANPYAGRGGDYSNTHDGHPAAMRGGNTNIGGFYYLGFRSTLFL